MPLDVLIEALLFHKSSALRKREVAAAVGISVEELPEQLRILRQRLDGGALTLVETEADVQLVTAPSVTSFLDAVRRDELRTEIGKAGAETLAIVLYKEPVSRAEIDRIRGVNSSVTIRNLMTRGLIAREKKQGNGAAVFTITPQLLTHLGIERKQDLPEYGAILDRIEAFEATLVATDV